MGLMDRWTSGDREAPEPLEGNVPATVLTGTVIWFLLFVGQLPFYGWFHEHGHLWWVWTCAAGAGLGLVGLWYVRSREAAIRAAAEAKQEPKPEADAAEGHPGDTGDGTEGGTGDGGEGEAR